MSKSNLEQAMGAFRKNWGSGVMIKASEIKRLPRISTKVFSLDAYLGGGFPIGAITELVGEPSGGKSTVAQFAVASAQKTSRETYNPIEQIEDKWVDVDTGEVTEPMRCVWLDSEGTFDPRWAAMCGIDLDELLYTRIAYQEQAFDMMTALIRTGDVDVIVLDSIAAMSPATEKGRSMEDDQMALGARVNNKGFRKLTAEFNALVQSAPHAPGVIMINQLREKVGVVWGNPEVTPGGRGQEFFATLRIKVWPQALGKATTNADGEIVARESSFKIEKNKLNGVHGDGKFTVYMRDLPPSFEAGDTDEPLQVIDWAVRFDLFEKSGNWITTPDGEKHNGLQKATDHLMSHPEMYQSIRREVLKKVNEVYR